MTLARAADGPMGFEERDLVALIPQVRAFARSLCRDPTQGDDLAQDALASAWRRRDGYIAGTHLQAWVFTIVRNQFISDRRRSWRLVQLDAEDSHPTLVVSVNPTAAIELDDLRRAMLALSDVHCEAVLLVGVAGLTYQQAAVIGGCAEGTMKSRVSRARRHLAGLLAAGHLSHPRRTPAQALGRITAAANDRLAAFAAQAAE